jgi:hypothetical protein
MWYLASVQFTKRYGDLVCGSCFNVKRQVCIDAMMYVCAIDTDGKQMGETEGRIDKEGEFHST